MPKILVFTPIHGRADLAAKTFASIEAHVPRPFVHLVMDDFSPPEDSKWLEGQTGTLGGGAKRSVVKAKNLGKGLTEAPNLGATLGFAWEQARNLSAEALLCVESDVLLRPDIVEAFREAQALHRGLAGAVAPLFVRIGQNKVHSCGGMAVWKAGVEIGTDVTTINRPVPTIDTLLWTHLACLWIPGYVLNRTDVFPDPAFRLCFLDHDIGNQIKKAGFELIVTDRAIAEHDQSGPSRDLLYSTLDLKNQNEVEGSHQLQRKWK